MNAAVYSLGIDPAKGSFAACLLGPRGAELLSPTEYPMSAEGLEALRKKLQALVPKDATLFAGIEASCALDDNLLHYFRNLEESFSITTLRLDGAQTRHFSGPVPVRGKSDRADARRMAAFTAAYAGRLSAFTLSPECQTMASLANERLALTEEIVRVKNRLRDYLVRIFPEFERVMGGIFTPTALALLRKAPTPSLIVRMGHKALSEFRAKTPHARALGEKKAEALLAQARRSIGCQSVSREALWRAIDLLELLLEQREEIDETLSQILAMEGEECPKAISEARAITSIPGIGPVTAITITARSQGLSRFVSAKAFAAQMAAHPCEDQTGTSRCRAALSHRGDRRSRSLLFQAALCATSKNPIFAFHAWRHREKGLSAKQAVCAVMNHLARLCWKIGTTGTAWSTSRAMSNILKHHAEQWERFLAEHPAWQRCLDKIHSKEAKAVENISANTPKEALT